MRGKHLGYTADVRRDDQETAASSFKDSNTEGLGEGSVQEDMTAAENVANLFVLQTSEELDSLAQVMLLDQLLEVGHAFTITADDEVHVFELCEDLRNDTNEKIDALAVRETGDEDNVDSVWVARLGNVSLADARIRSKSAGVNGIGDRESFAGINFCAKHKVLLACVTDADGGVEVTEAPFDQFVEVNAEDVVEREQRVLSEDGLEAERLC